MALGEGLDIFVEPRNRGDLGQSITGAGIRCPGSGIRLGRCLVVNTKCNVPRNRLREKKRLLRHKPDGPSQPLEWNLAHVNGVHEYCAWRWLVQPRQERDQR